MRPSRAALAVALAVALTALPAQADQATTRCVFDGHVPGFRALRLDLPAGSDFLVLELNGQRDPRPLNDEEGWHLAEGIAVIDATNHEIVAHQVLYTGSAAPVVVADVDGQRVRQGVAAPEGPWIHSARKARSDLPPGSYYVVAFGTGGPSGGAFGQWWGASIYVRGAHTCNTATAGETFDYDHTDFEGGTQVHVPGLGVAEDAQLEFETERPLVFGLMDAAYQGQASGSVALDYDLPDSSGTLGREIAPFVSSAGPHAFRAGYTGAYPLVGVAGVGLELPDG